MSVGAELVKLWRFLGSDKRGLDCLHWRPCWLCWQGLEGGNSVHCRTAVTSAVVGSADVRAFSFDLDE